MFINYGYYREIGLADLQAVRMQDHAKRYFSDLYGSYKMPLEINKIEMVYRYDDIASYLFDDKYNQKVCAKSDYLFFPSWGWVLDSNYAMPELYLKNKFKWGGSILDIRDCGSLCAYYALHLMLTLYQNCQMEISACCSIECAFKSSIDFDNQLFPEINYVGLLSFSGYKNARSDIEVIYCNLHSSNDKNANYQTLILEKVNLIASRYHIAENKYQILLRSVADDIHLSKNIEIISHPISSGFLYDIIDHIQKFSVTKHVEYMFIIDVDLTTQFYGVLLIKLGGKYVDIIAR